MAPIIRVMLTLQDLLKYWELNGNPIIEPEDDRFGARLGVAADTVRESLDHYLDTGGATEDLARILYPVLRRGLVVDGTHKIFSLDDILMADLISTEAYFLLSMAMKLSIGDFFYHYESVAEHYSSDHKFFELGPLQGSDIVLESGSSLKGISGRNFKTALRLLRSQYGNKQVKKLLSLLNMFIVDERYQINLDSLVSAENWYSAGFAQNFIEFVKVLSGNDWFIDQIGKNNIPKAIKAFGQSMSAAQSFHYISSFSSKYVTYTRIKTVAGGDGFAVVRLYVDDSLGHYTLQARANGCHISGKTMESIPDKGYGLELTGSIETVCAVDGVRDISPRDLPLRMDPKLRREILSREPGKKYDYCEKVYTWKPEVTGWRKFFIISTRSEEKQLGIIPSLSDLKKQPARSIVRIAKLALALTPLGAYAAQKELQEKNDVIRFQSETIEEGMKENEDLSARLSVQSVRQIDETHGILWRVSSSYAMYQRAIAEDDKLKASEALRTLQKATLEHPYIRELESISGSVQKEELKKRLKNAHLYAIFGKLVGDELKPEPDLGHNMIFFFELPGDEKVFVKKFDFFEAARSEITFYEWLRKRTGEQRTNFPVPEVLACQTLKTIGEDGKTKDLPIILMENMEGSNMHMFLQAMNQHLGIDKPVVKRIKESLLEQIVDDLAFILNESERQEYGSLGFELKKHAKSDDLTPDYFSRKLMDIFDYYLSDSRVEERSLLSRSISLFGNYLASTKKVTFFDMSLRNVGGRFREIYKKLLEDMLSADAKTIASELSRSIDEITDSLIRLLAGYSEETRGKSYENLETIAKTIISRRVYYDWEHIHKKTLEYDDLAHAIDSPAYRSSQEEKEKLIRKYLEQRGIPDTKEERERLLAVSAYRNIRMIKWDKDSFGGKEWKHYLRTAIEELTEYMRLTGQEPLTSDLDSETRIEKTEEAIAYIRSYLEGWNR